MAVGKTQSVNLLPIKGIRIGIASAGIKQTERDDVTVFEIAENSTVAALFTKNKFCAAPVLVSQKNLKQVCPQYLLINSGNANAGTGEKGLADANESCQQLATLLNIQPEFVLPFSTGVIGEPLPVKKLSASLPFAISSFSEDGWARAAEAIMTTDTREKGCSRTFSFNEETVTVTGIAKGSGMIRPDMATMLSYIATDLAIEATLLQQALKEAVDLSFNSITVDGDTSTNDSVVLMATGASKHSLAADDKESELYSLFVTTLIDVCQFLAEAIVRDGEGATKLITVQIEQANSLEDAREVAYTVAQSPLVKTAFFASDPNWGRILAAVGRANIAELDVEKVSIYLGEVCIVRSGQKADDYSEQQGQQVMDQDEITVRVNLQQGAHSAHILSCDLSYDYVKINAEYRT